MDRHLWALVLARTIDLGDESATLESQCRAIFRFCRVSRIFRRAVLSETLWANTPLMRLVANNTPASCLAYRSQLLRFVHQSKSAERCETPFDVRELAALFLSPVPFRFSSLFVARTLTLPQPARNPCSTYADLLAAVPSSRGDCLSIFNLASGTLQQDLGQVDYQSVCMFVENLSGSQIVLLVFSGLPLAISLVFVAKASDLNFTRLTLSGPTSLFHITEEEVLLLGHDAYRVTFRDLRVERLSEYQMRLLPQGAFRAAGSQDLWALSCADRAVTVIVYSPLAPMIRFSCFLLGSAKMAELRIRFNTCRSIKISRNEFGQCSLNFDNGKCIFAAHSDTTLETYLEADVESFFEVPSHGPSVTHAEVQRASNRKLVVWQLANIYQESPIVPLGVRGGRKELRSIWEAAVAILQYGHEVTHESDSHQRSLLRRARFLLTVFALTIIWTPFAQHRLYLIIMATFLIPIAAFLRRYETAFKAFEITLITVDLFTGFPLRITHAMDRVLIVFLLSFLYGFSLGTSSTIYSTIAINRPPQPPADVHEQRGVGSNFFIIALWSLWSWLQTAADLMKDSSESLLSSIIVSVVFGLSASGANALTGPAPFARAIAALFISFVFSASLKKQFVRNSFVIACITTAIFYLLFLLVLVLALIFLPGATNEGSALGGAVSGLFEVAPASWPRHHGRMILFLMTDMVVFMGRRLALARVGMAAIIGLILVIVSVFMAPLRFPLMTSVLNWRLLE